MCGLTGAMSSMLSQQEDTIFRHLMNVSSLRGFQGSGVVVHQKEFLKDTGTIRSLRTKRIAGALAYSGALDELLKPRHNCIIGHARWPTKGGLDIKAIHPHRAGHIIGVHNGTMYKVNGKAVDKDQSDSALLFQSFAENGVVETIKKSDGAYALVWIDEKDQTLNFLRNSQRTLYFKNVGWNENINTLYWSSEQEMLDFIFSREFRGKNHWNTYLPVDTWFKYPLDVQHKIVPCEVVKEVKPEPKVYPMGEYRGRGHGGNHSAVYGPDDAPWDFRNSHGQTMEFDPTTQRMVPVRNNVLRLPAPDSQPLSKRDQRRLKAQLRAEERQEAVRQARLERFRRANAEAIGKNNIAEAMQHAAELNDDISDVGNSERVLRGFEGRECAWCGSIACAGDTVYPVSSSRGVSEFLCDDCSRNPDCQVWVEHEHGHTILN